ncbi:CbtB domain-containing protein [Pseudoruegeria sp. HB172150]|uniref:CbtB domain-containing protein n=1 Tax=Pseudoruegeria sp. HB172150 TaxID=2721164 RepID=UPI00155807F5|nr:CbtB domain-containing protein [Pseudoruegeria sp. HB172150]
MTTQTQTAQGQAARGSAAGAAIAALLIGAAIIFVTGHVQASTLHDAAHDVRHATGFPCH